MDTEIILKVLPIVTTLVFGASTLILGIKQSVDGGKAARREEYKFAKAFFEDLVANPAMHRFARSKGFQAIGQSKDLPSSVIEHLMEFDDAVAALGDYAASKSYLVFDPTLDILRLHFQKTGLFATHNRRAAASYVYVGMAIICYLLIFAPWFIWTLNLISVQTFARFSILLVPTCISITFLSAREFVRLRRAMRLIAAQNQLSLSSSRPTERPLYEVTPTQQPVPSSRS